MNSGSKADIRFNAWLAGFIDGDGSIIFSYDRKRRRVQPRISIGNTHYKSLTYIRRKIGFGSIILLKAGGFESKRAQKRDHWHIQWVGLQALEVAKRIYPDLYQKKKHCKLLSEYKPMIPGTGFNKKNYKARQKLAMKMKELNENIEKR